MPGRPVSGAIARKLDRTVVELRGAQRSSVRRAGQQLARSVEVERDKVAPGGLLRNVGKNGARITVRVTTRENRADSEAFVRAVGPWQIINNPAKPHKIYRKGQRVRGRGAQRANRQAIYNELFGARGAYTGGALKMPDGRYRHVVDHPGHPGRQMWQKGIARGRAPARSTLRRSLTDAAVRGFRS